MINSNVASFQTGVDAIYNKCVSCGVTPTAKTPEAIATAIGNLKNISNCTIQFTGRYWAGNGTNGTISQESNNYTITVSGSSVTTNFSSMGHYRPAPGIAGWTNFYIENLKLI